MHRIAATLAIVVALLFGAGAACADFDDGVAAFKRGDSATAFLEWVTSAEQGLALAPPYSDAGNLSPHGPCAVIAEPRRSLLENSPVFTWETRSYAAQSDYTMRANLLASSGSVTSVILPSRCSARR
jgi:hypothetical protein